jgi:hypothetical protein
MSNFPTPPPLPRKSFRDEIMWKNIVEPDNIIRSMYIACWLAEVTNTHTEYVILLFDGNSGYAYFLMCYVIFTLSVFIFILMFWPLVMKTFLGIVKSQLRLDTLNKIQINQPTRCNNFSSLLLDVYLQISLAVALVQCGRVFQSLCCIQSLRVYTLPVHSLSQ